MNFVGRPAASPCTSLTACLAVALLLALTWLNSRGHFPDIGDTVEVDIAFPRGIAGQSEPVLITGMHAEGDVLVVKYLGETSAVFAYDHWGMGGPSSTAFTFRPGEPQRLRVRMPSLTTFVKPPPGSRGPLRVELNGRELLAQDVPYHGRQPCQIFFATNSIGASTAREFDGEIRALNGRVLRGGPESFVPFHARVGTWMRTMPKHAAFVVLATAAIAALTWWAFPLAFVQRALAGIARGAEGVRRVVAPHGWFLATAAIASVGYAWLVTGGTFRFDHREDFGVFYDYQLASLLQGRLDVPEEAIGDEAFEANGKLYGYFGPTPALLRLPFAPFAATFGKLSRAFMLGYFVAALVACYLLLREAHRWLDTRGGESAALSGFAVAVFISSVAFGSTLLFLGSRALIFHEAILCGVTFALWSAWWSLRHLREPTTARWIGAFACGALSLHARPPTGLFALTLLGVVALVLAWRELRRTRTLAAITPHLGVGVLCVAGFASLNGLAYLKFGTFDPAPLRMSRPFRDPDRLRMIEGKSFHLANLPYNFDAYVLRPNFRTASRFPWIYLGSNTPRREFPESRIDLPDFTLGFPYAMTSLFALATLGCAVACVARSRLRPAIAVVWLAGIPMTLALFAAVAIAQRYTGDFCPFLITAAAFGLVAVETAPARRRFALRSVTVIATLWAAIVTSAITLDYQGEALWGVPEETRLNYQRLRRRVDAFFGVPVPHPPPPLPPPRTHADP